MNTDGRSRRILRAIEFGFVEVALLVLVGLVFTVVAFVTRLALGVDVT